MAGVIYIPTANAADVLTGAVLDSDATTGTTSAGLANGTAYKAYALSVASASFTPTQPSTRDTFTTGAATPLVGYAGETAKVWTWQGGGTGQAGTIEGGRLRANGSNTGRLISQGTAPIADQYAVGRLRRGSSASGSAGPSLAVRMAGENAYWARYYQASNSFQLYKTAGTTVQLGATIANSGNGFDAEGAFIDFRLEAQGTTIRVLVNGAQILSATDTALASGTPGMRLFGGSGDALGVNAEFDDFGGGLL